MLPDQVSLSLEQRAGPLHILWLGGVTLASSLLVWDTALGPYPRPILLTVKEPHSKLALLQPVAPLLVVAGSVPPAERQGRRRLKLAEFQGDRSAYEPQVRAASPGGARRACGLHLLTRPSAIVLRWRLPKSPGFDGTAA